MMGTASDMLINAIIKVYPARNTSSLNCHDFNAKKPTTPSVTAAVVAGI